MARQRNNVARLPAEVRREVARLLFDGATYDQVRAAVQTNGLALHNNSLLAYQKSPEYSEYRARRNEFEREIGADRVIAQAINDGRGPESITDLIVMDVVREVRTLTRGGIADPATLANVTRCIAPILRKQQADAKLAQDTRLADAEARHAADLAAKDAELASLRAELDALRNPQSGPLTTEQKIDAIRERLGVK